MVGPISALAMETYWRRTCQGKEWKSHFPTTPASEIRKFLQIFVHAFALPTREYLQFSPDDKLSEIYNLLTPMGSDSLEYEHLDKFIQHHYKLPLTQIWHPALTLGELFTAIRFAP